MIHLDEEEEGTLLSQWCDQVEPTNVKTDIGHIIMTRLPLYSPMHKVFGEVSANSDY